MTDVIIERMYECLNLFSEPTKAWFEHAFKCPTDTQRQAWPAIRSGGNVLVTAPTGSGKTLCAFLSAIDGLMGESAAGTVGDGGNTSGKPKRGVRVLYISPLKCKASGLPAPKVRVCIRSGDTAPKERRAIVNHPPDILVTTPESLFLMLTSKARRILSTVETVIVDEVHAVAGSKRGAHLALSLERLDGLVGHPVQRIGLSATVNPPEEAARFLGGAQAVRIINPGTRPAMDLKVVEPLEYVHGPKSSEARRRAGGVDSLNPRTPRISGVTPALESLAERKGIIRKATTGSPASPGLVGGSV